ncbi:hypothetical protein Golomagni_08290, partial [Golovinomyces magnicellulatus]
MTTVPVMADYYKVGPVDGKKPASQWLARLAYEKRRIGNEGTPEDFFEAVEILFEEDAASWLNSCSRYRRMVDSRDKATNEDVEEFKMAFQTEFPARSLNVREEGNVSAEINSLEQGPEESLRAYYGRSQELLRRIHGRDAPEKGASVLAPIEAVVLSNIVAAFLGGLTDDSIRSMVLARPNILSESLRGAYNAAEEAKSTIEKLYSMER